MKLIRIILAAGFLLTLWGCASSPLKQGRKLAEEGRHDEAIAALEAATNRNPDDFRLWQELGIAWYKKGDLTKAEDILKQSENIKADARTSLYLGLIYEQQEFFGRAIDSYRQCLAQKPKGESARLVREHLDQLINRRLGFEVKTALTNEESLKTDSIPENTIGVVDFDAAHLPTDLAPLGKGLAEFTAIDLAKVQSLRVVDRLKIDMILKELTLGSSEYTDPQNSPRLGRLLGSNRLVTGAVTGLGAEEIRLDGAVVQTRDSSMTPTGPSEGKLEGLFKIQKEFVNRILDNMGITLTEAEKDSLGQFPTESYLAFLSYCRGLDYRGQGMYREAQQEFRSAYNTDGRFTEAAKQAEMMASLAQAPTPPDRLESILTESGDGDGSGEEIDDFQSSILDNTGFIDDINNLDRHQRGPIIPPRPSPTDNDATILIRGNLDVRP